MRVGRMVDLSMPIEEGMQTFAAPWHPYVEITILGRHGIENRETRKLVLGTHTGTHIDAPRHFIPGGATVESISLEQLNGLATVLDLSDCPPGQAVDHGKLLELLSGREVERLILRFDWDRHLGTNQYYSDHPYLTEESCRWLVDNGCRLLAMDTPQPDDPRNGRDSDNDAPNHKILLANGVILAEYLVNLKELTQAQVFLVVAPLKVSQGDGAPARVFAIEQGE